MNPRETAALLRLLAALDGRLRRAMADPQQAARTIDEWNEATAHIPAVTADGTWDASQAVRRFYEQRRGDHTARYFAYEPHHLLAAWAEHRTERMERHTDPLPAADPNDVHAYRAELAATRAEVAHGLRAPAPYHRAIDTAGRRQLGPLADRIGAMPTAEPGPYMPPQVRAEISPHLPGLRARLPALNVACPVEVCRAGARHLCTSSRGRELHTVHGRRRDAWAVTTANCPECGALLGQPCTAARDPHAARIQAAETAQGAPA
ncbi:zinc finger domain-containing protein [Streptomyces fractus]|uniref:zinc finger domain-containing protein n=1 Tax=Streptomyces fractus TaxID=641806 RepID=UPI003CEAD094